MKDSKLSRRDAVFQSGTAVAAIGVALAALTPRNAYAADDEISLLKALLAAERNAVKTYEAGKGVLDGAPSTDPLFAFQGIVTAIALHFRQQHVDHAQRLAQYITNQGGLDDVGAGAAQVPAGFVANIKNVVDLATNAEKAASLAYTNLQKKFGKVENAELAAAIGAVETQHFVVLQLVARGFVVPPDAVANKTAAELASTAAKFCPASFIVSINGSAALADTTALPFYDVTQ